MNELEILDKVEEMIKANSDDRMLAKGILNNLKLKDKELTKRKILLSTIIDLLNKKYLPTVYSNIEVLGWFKQNPEMKKNHKWSSKY
jgi:hypothetical protein